ncbi:MAG: type II toxin-antitoxin system RelE/ParE family toxin [Deinococcota bacterium]
MTALEFIETDDFTRQANKLLDDRGLRLVQNEIAIDPLRGNIIQGTGGARKLRVALPSQGKGKRGGARVVYYYQTKQGKVYLLDLYSKSQQDDLSEARKRELYQIIKTGLHDD